MKHPGKPKVVSSGDGWIADPYMSFSLRREEGWILRSGAGLGFKDWESLSSGRNSFQTLGVQGLWDFKPEPLPRNSSAWNKPPWLHHPMVPFKGIEVQRKDACPNKTSTRDVLWHSEVLGSLTPLSKESTTSKKLSPQPMFQGPMYTSDDDRTHLPFLRIAPYISKQITEKTTVQFLFHTLGRGQKNPHLLHIELQTEFIYKLA